LIVKKLVKGNSTFTSFIYLFGICLLIISDSLISQLVGILVNRLAGGISFELGKRTMYAFCPGNLAIKFRHKALDLAVIKGH